jgi:hypothetical protein
MGPSRHALAEDVRAYLSRDHARLGGLLDRFRDEPGENGSSVRRERWRDFEAAFLGHMAGEEKYLLTAMGSAHPEEAATLRTQHARLRQLLTAAGLGLQTENEALTALVVAFRDHAIHEERMLYEWAERAERGAAEDLIRYISGLSGGVGVGQRG